MHFTAHVPKSVILSLVPKALLAKGPKESCFHNPHVKSQDLYPSCNFAYNWFNGVFKRQVVKFFQGWHNTK